MLTTNDDARIDVVTLMNEMGRAARAAARPLATASETVKNAALHAMADALEANERQNMTANA
ncbi:MAG: gamma-glutamyl-phosphate reductase, partial [Nitratireductor sp.]